MSIYLINLQHPTYRNSDTDHEFIKFYFSQRQQWATVTLKFGFISLLMRLEYVITHSFLQIIAVQRQSLRLYQVYDREGSEKIL